MPAQQKQTQQQGSGGGDVVTGKIEPAATTVKRLYQADDMTRDRFAVLVDGDVLVEVDYQTARRYWLGRISLAELVNSGAASLKQ